MSIIGVLENCTAGHVSGWAVDRNHPELPPVLLLRIDGQDCGPLPCTLQRPDLSDTDYGGFVRGFRQALPRRYFDGQEHVVELAAEGTSLHIEGNPHRQVLAPADAPEEPPRLDAALVGRDGWLYLCNDRQGSLQQYNGRLRLTPAQLLEWQRLLEQRKQELQTLGIPYLFAIVPEKPSIYPEYLPDGIDPCPYGSPIDQLLAHLAQHSPYTAYLDLRSVLKAGKEQGPVYTRNDTHWNFRGAFLAAQAIVMRVRRYFPNVPPLRAEDYEVAELEGVSGNLTDKDRVQLVDGRLVPYPDAPPAVPETVPHYLPHFKSRARQVGAPAHLGSSEQHESLVYELDDPTLPSAVLFHDRWADWMIPFLAERFRRIAFVWRDSHDRSVIGAEQPEMVLQQVSERFLIHPPRT